MFFTVFARFDGWETDADGVTYSNSGRCVYLTDNRADADRVWSDWQRGTDTDDYGFFVRRGCVDEHNSYDAALNSDAWQAAEERDVAPSLEPSLL